MYEPAEKGWVYNWKTGKVMWRRLYAIQICDGVKVGRAAFGIVGVVVYYHPPTHLWFRVCKGLQFDHVAVVLSSVCLFMFPHLLLFMFVYLQGGILCPILI